MNDAPSPLNPLSLRGTVMVSGTNPGVVSELRVYDPAKSTPVTTIRPFGDSNTGGLSVATADVTGDHVADIIVGQWTGGSLVRVYDGRTLAPVPGPLGGPWGAYGTPYIGGIEVAAGDLTGDGHAEVITTTRGSNPQLRSFNGLSGGLLQSRTLTQSFFQQGVHLAAGNLIADDPATTSLSYFGEQELAVSSAGGTNPIVQVLDDTLSPVAGSWGTGVYAFGPYGASEAGISGAWVTTGDVTGDGRTDIVVGAGSGNNHIVRVFDFQSSSFQTLTGVLGAGVINGVRVATTYLNGDLKADVLAGTSGSTSVTAYSLAESAVQTIPVGSSSDLPGGGGPISGSPLSGFQLLPTPIRTDCPPVSPPGSIATASAADDQNPDDDGSGDCGVGMFGGNSGRTGLGGGAFSAHPIEYSDGAVKLMASDIQSDTFATPWAQERSWTNVAGFRYTAGWFGDGWRADQFPELQIHHDPANGAVTGLAEHSLRLVTNGTEAWVFSFDPTNKTYHSSNSDAARLYYAGGTTWTPTTPPTLFGAYDDNGNELLFYGFGPNTPAPLRGQLKSYRDASGTLTEIIRTTMVPFASDTFIGQVRRTGTVNGTPVTELWDYTYLPGGPSTGNLQRVTLRRSTDGGATFQLVRSAEYTYHDGTTAAGSARDLRTATIKDAAGNVIDTSYYRYWKAGQAGGYAHGLKYAFGPESYARLVAEVGSNVDALSDAQIAPYADNYFEYDATQRVTKEVAQGAGCSACTGGQGTYTYTYFFNTTTAPIDGLPNVWRMKTTETLPDASKNIVYTNGLGQEMLFVHTDAAGTQKWINYTRYDDFGRVILQADPSAVTGFDERYVDLVDQRNGNFTYLAANAGMVVRYGYYDASDKTAGAAQDQELGYRKGRWVERGTAGVPTKTNAWHYGLLYAANDLRAKIVVTASADFTDAGTPLVTSDAFQWSTANPQPLTQTDSLPVVSAAQNGSGVANQSVTAFDQLGRPVWTKDPAGFLTYTRYDPASGAVIRRIDDVDTTRTADFTGLPAGWATPAGGGRHLVTNYEVDGLGRVTKQTDPDGRVDYTVYNDAAHQIRYYRGWNATAHTPTGPTEVVREDRPGGYTETLTMSAVPAVDGLGRPTGAEPISGLQSLSREYTNRAHQVVYKDEYFQLSGLTYSAATTLGVEGVNFLRTRYQYAARGWLEKVTSPAGTITRTVFDVLGRPLSEWVGTDDTPTSGFWSPTNTAGTDLVKVRDYQYDGGGVGDGNLTLLTEYPGLGAAPRVTQTWYDWRDRPVVTKDGVQAGEAADVNRPLTYTQYDNLDRVVARELYDGDGVTPVDANGDGVPDRPAAGLLRAKSTTDYDDQSRVFRSRVYSVDPTTGAVSATALTSDLWYDPRGFLVKQTNPGGPVVKAAYDGTGRLTTTFASDGGGDAGYADALNVTGDNVLTQTEYQYDGAGNLILSTVRDRFHDATGTGGLGTATAGVRARVSYTAAYYDLADRPVADVNVGTNAAAAYTRPAAVPPRSDTVLVTSYQYDAAGRLWRTTDPKGRISQNEYDALGRTTRTIDNYVDGVPSDADDKTTLFVYGPAGLTRQTALTSASGGQTTEWVYGVSPATGSGLTSFDVVGAVRWPSPTTGAASASEQEGTTVNALGEQVTSTDRNGTVHAYAYDVLGRLVSDAVAALGAGVDGAVRRIDTAYDGQGNMLRVTSSDAVGGVVNQVERAYNGLGQLVSEKQAHGAPVTATTPAVGYTYSAMAGGANHSRPTGVVYPDGKVLTYAYNAGLDDAISRLSSISDTSGVVERYDYLGLDTVVRRSRPQPGDEMTLIKPAAAPVGDAGDQYTGLDRFGRVVDQRWVTTATGAALDEYQYGYDRTGDRTYRANMVNTTLSELYTYDGLDQLTSFSRGTLNSTRTALVGAASRSQSWNNDPVGNWRSVTTNGLTQTRTSNAQNETTAVGAAALGYDRDGSVTRDDAGRTLVYDAWNRLVRVRDAQGATVEAYSYDGLGRRVRVTSGATADPPPRTATVRASASSNGTQADGWSYPPAVSADGRYVAFPSTATNLVPGDTNGQPDIFVYDRVLGQTTRVSVGPGGVQANGTSVFVSLSADGRYVAFTSYASNLVAGDTNGQPDVFVYDRQTGVTTRVSVGLAGAQANGASQYVSISADGRYVAFVSRASNLVAGDTNGTDDVFVYDRSTGVTTRVSVGPGGAQSSGYCFEPSISADGRYVAFRTAAPLVAGDTNGTDDIFVYDRSTGVMVRASVGPGGTQANSYSVSPSISADGRYVAFESYATNLVAGDTNGLPDIFVYDRSTGVTARVSVGPGGAQSNGYSFDPSISGDGRYVAFRSSASTLVAGDTNGFIDVFVYDRSTGVTARVSVGLAGTQANDNSYETAISGDGRYVVFRSAASNLVAGDTNGALDVFVYDQIAGAVADPSPLPETTRASVITGGGQANGDSTNLPSVSPEGRYVVFESAASNLVAGDTNGTGDIFLQDRQTGVTSRVSVGPGGAQSNGQSTYTAVSADGRYVAFTSYASNLVAGDTNGQPDVFVYDRQAGVTTRVSVGLAGAQPNGYSAYVSMSADGRYVAFTSYASNLVAGDTNGFPDVFVYDRSTGVTTRVNVGPGGVQANGSSYQPVMSSDGRYVAFRSTATNLVAGDTNGTDDIFVYDRLLGQLTRVSVGAGGVQANGFSLSPSISADGRFVAFESYATNLVAGDTNGQPDIFVYDRSTGVTTRVSIGLGGAQTTAYSFDPSISGDGRYVAFRSLASNLVTGDAAGFVDIFVYDRSSGVTTRESVGPAGVEANGNSYEAVISGDGRYVVFRSAASNLVAGDTNGFIDVFVRDRGTAAARATTDLYYSTGSQVLEERVGGTLRAQYIWSPVATDTLVLRDRDTDGNASKDERLWVQQDANQNVTSLVGTAGNVVERFTYDPYGTGEVRGATWNVKSGSDFAWVYRHQGLRLDLATGTYYDRMREYSPTLGRFVQVDPIGFGGGDVNLYRYEGNDPTDSLDPTGEAKKRAKSKQCETAKNLDAQGRPKDQPASFDLVKRISEGKTLMVGEADLTLTNTLVKDLKVPTGQLTATTYEPQPDLPLLPNTEARAADLRAAGVNVLNSVNGTNLREKLGDEKYDTIVFAFPNVGSRKGVGGTAEVSGRHPNSVLIGGFLKSAAEQLNDGGKIVVVGVDIPKYRGSAPRWQGEFAFPEGAENAGLNIEGKYEFVKSDYPSYTHTMAGGGGSASTVEKEGQSFAFWVFSRPG
jgi:RHS repeat-associated protein